MGHSVKILVDHGEHASGVPALLERSGVEVERARLPAGDYLVGSAVAVERKATSDLARSIASGRLWRQLVVLHRTYRRVYLLVEGTRLGDRAVSGDGLRGALLQVIDGGAAVLWSGSPRESADWLRRLACRVQRDGHHPRPRVRGRPARRPADVLASVPGISPARAADLLDRYGSIAAVAAASDAELRSISGIGAARARALRSFLS
jgi:ERCC4-type nuclease